MTSDEITEPTEGRRGRGFLVSRHGAHFQDYADGSGDYHSVLGGKRIYQRNKEYLYNSKPCVPK